MFVERAKLHLDIRSLSRFPSVESLNRRSDVTWHPGITSVGRIRENFEAYPLVILDK